ncbi:hypothetical protein VUR80DRAFT_6352 [Thermomyces stellatus]
MDRAPLRKRLAPGEQRAVDGPVLLRDFHLIYLLSHFDRERVPERVVHAKGSGARGGKTWTITVRFSTVGGDSGSPGCARDPRGLSVTFKTDEGNWDFVGNNTSVFFLRDPAKFPDLIHTQKRDPATHLGAGDDSTMFWDYHYNNPESIHQVAVLMGDRGIPDGYRLIHGYSGHTLKFVNKQV